MAETDAGITVGNLPTAYNYLAGCLKDGWTYIQRYPEHKRERFLSPTELHRLGQALTAAEQDETETKYAIAAFRILLLTGCRLSEIQRLEWSYVDLQQKELRPPDSKTGAKTVHLGDAAVALLAALPRTNDNPYVIVGKKSSWAKGWR